MFSWEITPKRREGEYLYADVSSPHQFTDIAFVIGEEVRIPLGKIVPVEVEFKNHLEINGRRKRWTILGLTDS